MLVTSPCSSHFVLRGYFLSRPATDAVAGYEFLENLVADGSFLFHQRHEQFPASSVPPCGIYGVFRMDRSARKPEIYVTYSGYCFWNRRSRFLFFFLFLLLFAATVFRVSVLRALSREGAATATRWTKLVMNIYVREGFEYFLGTVRFFRWSL